MSIIINLGNEDRWLLGGPSPIQTNGDVSVLGNEDRWLLGEPPIIGTDEIFPIFGPFPTFLYL